MWQSRLVFQPLLAYNAEGISCGRAAPCVWTPFPLAQGQGSHLDTLTFTGGDTEWGKLWRDF